MLKPVGCGAIFREKISGAAADRPQLKKLMTKLGAANVVVRPRLTASRVIQPTF